LLAPLYGSASFPANGDFYFRASGRSVTLPAAGYDYNSDWTPLLAGLSPAGMNASLAARTSFALFAIGAIFPVAPFLWLTDQTAVTASVGLSALALGGIGVLTSLFNGRSPAFSAARQVVFGVPRGRDHIRHRAVVGGALRDNLDGGFTFLISFRLVRSSRQHPTRLPTASTSASVHEAPLWR
jgi:VIT family